MSHIRPALAVVVTGIVSGALMAQAVPTDLGSTGTPTKDQALSLIHI